MGAIIYVVALFWAVYIGGLFIKDKMRACIHPLVQFGVAQIVYFSTIPSTNAGQVGLLHLVTTASILFGFHLVRGGGPLGREAQRQFVMDQAHVQIAFLLLALSVCVLVPAIAILQGASPFEVLTSFYTSTGMAQVPALVAYFLTGMTKIPFIAIILGRVWFHTSGNPIVRNLWRVLFITQLALTFGSGVRSGLLFLVACFVLADVYVMTVLGLRQTTFERVRQRTSYLVMFGVLVFGITFLTAFRSVRFQSVGHILDAAKSVFAGGHGGAAAEAAQQEINQAVGFVVDYYGRHPTNGRGLYAQVTNVVPRVLWPGKPVGFGKQLAYDMMGTPYEDPLSLAAGIGGEAFYNFGWLGAMVFPAIFGMVGAVFYKKTITSPDPGKVACILIYIAWGTGICRGDWLSSVNVITYQIVVYFPVIWLLRTLLGTPARFAYVTTWYQAPQQVDPRLVAATAI